MGPKQKPIPALTKAIVEYMSGRDERMAAGEVEVELKGNLLALMHKHELVEYTDVDAEVTCKVTTEKEKVTASKLKPPKVEVE